MTDFIQQVTKLLGKEFYTWYGVKYTLPLKVFISLPETLQYTVVQLYIIEEYNIGIHFDIGSVVAYWFNPDLAFNQIRAASIHKGKLTTTILELYDLDELSFEDSYKRAIYETINKIQNPF